MSDVVAKRRLGKSHRVTSIGKSKNSRPKNKHKKRIQGSLYRGQGK
jgi:hypothetical protein